MRASGPLVTGRRSNDNEKAVAAVLGGRKRGFILDVQVDLIAATADAVLLTSLLCSGSQTRRKKTRRHGSRLSQVVAILQMCGHSIS